MSTTVSPGSVAGPGATVRRRSRFRAWRQQRPFWGCAFAIFAGIEIYLVAAAPLKVMAMQGLPGLLTLGVALIAVVLGGVTLFQPHLRSLTGLLTAVLGPLSIMATNLGGFIIGTVLLVIGGGLMLAWVPGTGVEVGGGPVGGGQPTHQPPVYGESEQFTAVQDVAPPAGTDPAAPATKQPRPAAPRSGGLAGVIDTMFGARVSGALFGSGQKKKRKPTAKKKPPTGKRPPQKRPAPTGQKKRPAQRKTTTSGETGPVQQETRNP